MSDETNDQLGKEGVSADVSNQHKDGTEAQRTTDGQGMGGQVSEQNVTDAAGSGQNASAPAPEEEPVGSSRPGPRPVRKMSAADFRVRSEPKQEQKPPAPEQPAPQQSKPAQPAASAPEPAQQPASQQHKPVQPAAPEQPAPQQHKPAPPVAAPQPAPQQPAPAKPEPEPRREPAVQPQPAPAPEPVQPAAPVYAQEPYREPVREEPIFAEAEYRPPEEPRRYEQQQYDQQGQGQGRTDAAPGGLMDAIMGILSFFTIFRINVGEKEIQAMNRNFWLVPAAGLLIGLIAAAVGVAFTGLRTGTMAVVAVIATSYILSKFLHFDGLADFGDGMIASGDRESSIRALKDTRIGAGGVGIALIVVLAIFAAFHGMWSAFVLAAVIVTMEVFAKNAMVAAAAFGEPGNGMASEQVRNTNMQTMFVSTAVSACLAFAGYLLMGVITSLAITHGMLDHRFMISAALVIAGAAGSSIFVGWLIAFLSNKKFGFVNGDVLGAANEISKVMILFVALLVVFFYLCPELGIAWRPPVF